MAFKAGHNSFIALDNVAGTPVTLSQYASQFEFPESIDPIEVSTFGSSSKRNIGGLADGGQVSMSGPLDVALATFIASQKAAILGGSTPNYTIQYGPGGSVSGQIKQSAEVFITEFSSSSDVSGTPTYSLTLQIDGAVTTTTW